MVYLLHLQKTWVWFSALYQEAQEICNSSSGGSNTFLDSMGTNMHDFSIHTLGHIEKKFFLSIFKGISSAVLPFLVQLDQIPER